MLMLASGVIGHSLLNPVQKVVGERRNASDTASTVSLVVVDVPAALPNMFHVRRVASGVPGASGAAAQRHAPKRTIRVSPPAPEPVSMDSVRMERRNKLNRATSKSAWQRPSDQRRQQRLPPLPPQSRLPQLRQQLPK